MQNTIALEFSHFESVFFYSWRRDQTIQIFRLNFPISNPFFFYSWKMKTRRFSCVRPVRSDSTRSVTAVISKLRCRWRSAGSRKEPVAWINTWPTPNPVSRIQIPTRLSITLNFMKFKSSNEHFVVRNTTF